MPTAKREIEVRGDIAIIPLTKGYEAVIDAADVHLVAGHQWRALVTRFSDGSIRTVYAQRTEWACGKEKSVLLHRLLLGSPLKKQVDHRDGSGLNNRRENLREATRSQNQHNRSRGVRNKSGFKGVSWHSASGKWRAQIYFLGKCKDLGTFSDINDAARAYAEASADLHGEFGRVA